jgi:hypothetical protein
MRRQAKKRLLIAVAAVVVLLVALRLALPTIVLRYVNKVLNESPTYEGYVTDIDIALLRGAYVIEGTMLEKRGDPSVVPFLDIERIDLSVEWKALLDGSLVAEIEMLRPKVNFVGGAGEENQSGGGTDWRQMVKDLVPIAINRFAVTDGEIHYVDPTSKPKVDIFVNALQLEIANLTNSKDFTGSLVSTLQASGKPMNLGAFEVEASLDPFEAKPTFDLDATMRKVPLKSLNDFLKAYGKLDVEAGTMDVYVEVAAKDGKFDGYLKPLLSDVKVLRLDKEVKQDKDSPLEIAWEAIIGGAKGLLENKKTEKVATRIPVAGTFDDPKVDAWATVFTAIRNAFIEALFAGVEGTIDMSDPEQVSVGGDEDEDNDEKKGGGLFKKKKRER